MTGECNRFNRFKTQTSSHPAQSAVDRGATGVWAPYQVRLQWWTKSYVREVRLLPKRCFMTEFPSESPKPPIISMVFNKVDDPRFILPDIASPARTHSFGDDGRTLGFHILCLFKSGLGSPGASLATYCPPRPEHS